jgi:predicted nucleic acid-binding protein
MDWVIDCSLALAWGLPDEQSPIADEFFTMNHAQQDLWVPSLWWFELANGLTMGRKRKRITDDQYVRLLRAYDALPIQTDSYSGFDFVDALQRVASQFSLSGYDAAYLELAIRKGAGLATLDQHLANMASRARVSSVFPS